MTKRIKTLRKRADFEWSRKNGVRFFSKLFVIAKSPQNKQSNPIAGSDVENAPRVAYIVSKKVSKLAVKRNRIKRRLREVVRRNYKDMEPGYDYVIIAKNYMLDSEFQYIDSEFVRGLKFLKNKVRDNENKDNEKQK